jgi:uncharacterized membrane protein YtjA (UPF0391 family)
VITGRGESLPESSPGVPSDDARCFAELPRGNFPARVPAISSRFFAPKKNARIGRGFGKFQTPNYFLVSVGMRPRPAYGSPPARRLLHQPFTAMLSYSLIFLIVAIVAGALGFWGISGLAASVAKILFFLFLLLFVVSLFTGRRSPRV